MNFGCESQSSLLLLSIVATSITQQNKHGVISYTEFLAATLEAQGHIDEYRIAEAFDGLDCDGSGYISKDDLREILGAKCTNEYVMKLLEEFDADGDGQISYPEFKRAFEDAVDMNIVNLYDAGSATSSD